MKGYRVEVDLQVPITIDIEAISIEDAKNIVFMRYETLQERYSLLRDKIVVIYLEVIDVEEEYEVEE